MGNADYEVVVQTTFETSEALMNAIGSSVHRGRLCLPMRIDLDQPFQLVLATRDGERTVVGRVEVVSSSPESSWLRFASATAADDAGSVNHVLSKIQVRFPESLRTKIGFVTSRTRMVVIGGQVIAEIEAPETTDPAPVSFDDPTSVGPRIVPR